jgi:hypothetical protein
MNATLFIPTFNRFIRAQENGSVVALSLDDRRKIAKGVAMRMWSVLSDYKP